VCVYFTVFLLQAVLSFGSKRRNVFVKVKSYVIFNVFILLVGVDFGIRIRQVGRWAGGPTD